MRRRGRRAAAGLIREVWLSVECPSCARPVAFLPSQQVNVCGWCQQVVTRGLE